MKIGIIGCSQSAALTSFYYERNKNTNAQAYHSYCDGYPYFLAKLYPQHSFYLVASPGTGFDIYKLAIPFLKEHAIDVLLLQLTDIRYTYSITSQIIKNEKLIDPDNIFQERPHHPLTNLKHYIISPKKTKTHIRKHITYNRYQYVNDVKKLPPSLVSKETTDIEMFDITRTQNLHKLLSVFDTTISTSKILKEDLYRDEINKYWLLNINKNLKANFDNFFILDGTSIFYRNTIFEHIARQDWQMSIFEWFVDYLKKLYNFKNESQAISLVNHIIEPYGGHIPGLYYQDFVNDVILTNQRFASILNSK